MKLIYCSTLISVILLGCNSNSVKQDSIPSHDNFIIKSKEVGETRVINVWKPSEYILGKDSLPVIYMADGGVKEDFPHIANTLSELVKLKTIPPVILIGIENTQRRRDLTGFTEVDEDKKIAPTVGGSEEFRAFIKEELFPEIQKRYRTTKEKGIIGESAAGLFVVETFMLQPEMFDFYIAMDPSLWWNNHYLVRTAKEHLAKNKVNNTRFWFAGSETKDIAPYTKELASILKTENFKNLKWNYSDEPNESHSTIFRATKEKALKWTFNNI